MLYMRTLRKQRVTFRVAPDLARKLQGLPNQTLFVEAALRDALARTCPLCDGKGQIDRGRLAVTNFAHAKIPTLDAESARRLRQIVRLGRRIHATALDVRHGAAGWQFSLKQRERLLLSGRVNPTALTLAS
jgi:hypothetical protein